MAAGARRSGMNADRINNKPAGSLERNDRLRLRAEQEGFGGRSEQYRFASKQQITYIKWREADTQNKVMENVRWRLSSRRKAPHKPRSLPRTVIS